MELGRKCEREIKAGNEERTGKKRYRSPSIFTVTCLDSRKILIIDYLAVSARRAGHDVAPHNPGPPTTYDHMPIPCMVRYLVGLRQLWIKVALGYVISEVELSE